MKNTDTEVTFEIIKEIGVVSKSDTGWETLLCLVSWCGRKPKFDCRSWSPDRKKCNRGSTFTREEAETLMKLLQSELQ